MRKRDVSSFIVILLLIISALTVAIIINNTVDSDNVYFNAKMFDVDNGDTKINWDKYSTSYIDLSQLSGPLSISESGVYHLTGTLNNQAVIVNGVNKKVKLILDNVEINNQNGPAIACLEGDDLVIELIGLNTLEDGETYSLDYDEDVNGVIYSKADLTLLGEGYLYITANYADGIVSKDDLKVANGYYRITAKDDGIRGKDSVYILAGDYRIESGADAIKSTNEDTSGKGFVLIEDGNYSITATGKGMKAVNGILIKGGDFLIDSKDDAIHSNDYAEILGGRISINSGDDGLHADKRLIIGDGEINVLKSYEGMEAQAVTINGGHISINASDDGINAGGGTDGSANNRPGMGQFDVNTDCILTINDGTIRISASGDGLDSNGYLYINGGSLIVDGPTNDGNGALDAGGGIIMSGGEVIAAGSSGMAETLGSNSLVNNISVYFDSQQATGTKVEIKNSADETVMEYVSKKSFNHLAAGSSNFEYGESYTIYINGDYYNSFTISSVTTTIGNMNNVRGGDPRRNPSSF